MLHCVCSYCAVINGEKAAYSTPVFADKRERTLDLLLKSIEQNYSTKVSQDVIVCAVLTAHYTERHLALSIWKQEI